MSDEAFARRFYSDRAELGALGVPLTSQRDEFTGEELYNLRSEHYFLDRLELEDDELAALQTALYALEGKFAYAEPLRLALQNLALGRPGFRHSPTRPPSACASTLPTTPPSSRAASRSSSRRSRSNGRSSSGTGRPHASARPSARSIRMRFVWTKASGTSSVTTSTATRSARSASRGSGRTSGSRRGGSATSVFRPTSTSTPTACLAPGRSAELVGDRPDRRPGRYRLVGPVAPCPTPGPRGRCLRDPVQRARAARLVDPPTERPGDPTRTAGAARRPCAKGSPCSVSATPVRRRTRLASGASTGAAHRRPAGAGPGGARALRCPPGTARAPPHRVRRGERRQHRCRRARGAIHDPPRRAPGAPLAPEPRELRRRVLRRLRRGERGDRTGAGSTRSCTATCSGGHRSSRRSRPVRSALRSSTSGRPSPRTRIRRSSACAASSRRPSASSSLPRRRRRGWPGTRKISSPPSRRRPRSAASSRSSTSRRARSSPRRGWSSPTRSSGSCPSGACTPGIAPSTGRGRSGSTGCVLHGYSRRRSSRVTASIPTTSPSCTSPDSGTRRRLPAGSWSAGRGN